MHQMEWHIRGTCLKCIPAIAAAACCGRRRRRLFFICLNIRPAIKYIKCKTLMSNFINRCTVRHDFDCICINTLAFFESNQCFTSAYGVQRVWAQSFVCVGQLGFWMAGWLVWQIPYIFMTIFAINVVTLLPSYERTSFFFRKSDFVRTYRISNWRIGWFFFSVNKICPMSICQHFFSLTLSRQFL